MEDKKKNPALEKAIKLQSRENTFENGQILNTVNGVYSGAMIDEVIKTEKEVKNNAVSSKKSGNGSAKVDQTVGSENGQTEQKREKNTAKNIKKVNIEKDDSSCKDGRCKDKNNRRKTHGGWVVAVCLLSITTATLGGLFAYNLVTTRGSDRSLNNLYEKSFYSAVDRVNNADLNMDKFLVTTDEGASVKYLMDITVDAEIAEENFAQLPLNYEDKIYTSKLINQVADYSKYLAKKLADGDKLNEQDLKNAKLLSTQLKSLKNALNDMQSSTKTDGTVTATTAQNGYTFNSLSKNKTLQNGLKELQNQSVEYPSLIYDGPFSDAKSDEKMNGLTGKQITKEDAQNMLKKIFKTSNIKDLKYDGETSGRVTAYTFSFDTDFGKAYAQIGKTGALLMLTSESSNVDIKMRSDKSKDSEDIATAENFLAQLGIDNTKAVWTAKVDGVSIINFVAEKDGVIIYPDMIKVKVKNSTVVGLESYEYYLNHKDRSIDKPTVTESEARAVLHSGLEVKNSRMAIVPNGAKEELCYEFMCEMEGVTYYSYISATTKKQVELFEVQDGTEGVLLR